MLLLRSRGFDRLGGAYQIERSLRFNSADTAYLNRTPASATNRTTWTYSCWIKRSTFPGGDLCLLSAGDGTQNEDTNIFFNPSSGGGGSLDSLRINNVTGGSTVSQLISTAVFRDPTAWMHIVVAVDTTNGTANNRYRMYVNGTELTSFSVRTNPGVSESTYINSAQQHRIGRNQASTYFPGYLTEINFIDGQQLTPSSFGETDATTGAWNPIAYSGSYGTNGFELNFSDNSNTTSTTLGKDYSGNGNNWTPNNFSVTAGAGNDSLTDTPTNYGTSTDTGGVMRGNYSTLNCLWFGNSGGGTSFIRNGNLEAGVTGGNGTLSAFGTMAMYTGKWVYEITLEGSTLNYFAIGICPIAKVQQSKTGDHGNNGIVQYMAGAGEDGKVYNNAVNVQTNTASSAAIGGVARCEINLDTGSLQWFYNGTSKGTYSFSVSGGYVPVVAINDAGCQFAANFGQRAFVGTPSSGFLSLCTQNMADSAVEKPSTGFIPALYTGTGATLSITGLNFGPDFVWIKSRSAATDHALYDTSRGTQARLESNNSDAEATSDGGLTTFGSAGFTLGTLAQVNTSSATYVAWCWEEGATYGFDIIAEPTHNTTGTVTITHNLGAVPHLVVLKGRSTASSWATWHNSLTANYLLYLDSTGAQSTAAGRINNLTSSSFDVVNWNNLIGGSGGNAIAYVWAPVAGFSFFGSYTGNGSTDGPFISTGFRPAYFFTKRYNNTGAYMTWDDMRLGYNVDNNDLRLNSTDSEQSDNVLDFVAAGVKLRNNDSTWYNTSSDTYVVAAFASQNFKNARAR